jgi:hypothetical protein
MPEKRIAISVYTVKMGGNQTSGALSSLTVQYDHNENGPLSGFGLVLSANFTMKYSGEASRDFCFLKMEYAR